MTQALYAHMNNKKIKIKNKKIKEEDFSTKSKIGLRSQNNFSL
jgi:hypothetical protein